MTTYVMRNGQLVEKHLAAPRGPGFVRGVISDHIPDLVHPATGKKMDSKSAFRAVTKAHGMIEMGNEKQRDRRAPVHQDFSRDVAEAVRKVNEGYRPNSPEHVRWDGKGDWQ